MALLAALKHVPHETCPKWDWYEYFSSLFHNGTKFLMSTVPTNDLMIRSALKKRLENNHVRDERVRIIEEFGVQHGVARIDIAVVNGIMHGYEIKSDQDTLQRLPEQMSVFNSVFDRVTLVVGKSHLYGSINIIPDWWGIVVAKVDSNNVVTFNTIRGGENNKGQDRISVARLLWRDEALKILEAAGKASGVYSKSRNNIYERLSSILDQKNLGNKVRETILIRSEWRPDAPLMTSGG